MKSETREPALSGAKTNETKFTDQPNELRSSHDNDEQSKAASERSRELKLHLERARRRL